jgi:hypothetical protein
MSRNQSFSTPETFVNERQQFRDWKLCMTLSKFYSVTGISYVQTVPDVFGYLAKPKLIKNSISISLDTSFFVNHKAGQKPVCRNIRISYDE